MINQWYVESWRPSRGQFSLVTLQFDWCAPCTLPGGEEITGWFIVTAELLGFGASLTCWRRNKPEVYQDGGDA